MRKLRIGHLRLAQMRKTTPGLPCMLARVLTAVALVPLVMVGSHSGLVDALETDRAVVYDNQFAADATTPAHEYGVTNMKVQSVSGARIAPGSVAVAKWSLWNGKLSSPPEPFPLTPPGRSITTTTRFPAEVRVIDAAERAAHPEWNLPALGARGYDCLGGAVRPGWSCTLHTNADGTSVLRLSGKPANGEAPKVFWQGFYNIQIPVFVEKKTVTGLSNLQAHVQFAVPQSSTKPNEASLDFEVSQPDNYTFGLYGANNALSLEPNHPGPDNYWPKGGKGKIAFDVQPKVAPRPVTVKTGEVIQFRFQNVYDVDNAKNSELLYYAGPNSLEPGYPVNDYCYNNQVADWKVSCVYGGSQLTMNWIRTGPSTTDAFSQPLRVELPVSRGSRDDTSGSTYLNVAVTLTAGLSADAISSNLSLNGRVNASTPSPSPAQTQTPTPTTTPTPTPEPESEPEPAPSTDVLGPEPSVGTESSNDCPVPPDGRRSAQSDVDASACVTPDESAAPEPVTAPAAGSVPKVEATSKPEPRSTR